jgi:hypothetical protein
VLDATPLQLGQYFAQFPSVAAVGTHFLAAWQRNFSHDDPRATIHAAFVELDGTSPGDFGVGSYGSSTVSRAAVASDGTTALVAWQDGSTGTGSGADIRGALVTGGPPGQTVLISTADDSQTSPAVTWDGAEFIAAFEDLRNITFFIDRRTDLFGARVSDAGAVLDPNGFPIADGAVAEKDVAVAGASGNALFAGAVFEPGDPHSAYRIEVREQNGSCTGAISEYGTGCPGSGGTIPTLDLSGCPAASQTLTLDVAGGLPGGSTTILFGLGRASLPLPGGCTLLTAPLLLVVTLPLDAAGELTISAMLSASVPSTTLDLQAFLPDAGAAAGFSNTNGVEIFIP